MEEHTKRHDLEIRSSPQSEKDTSPSTTRVPVPNKVYPAGWKLTIIMVSLSLGNLLIAVDNTIIAVAIPVITTRFDSLDDVGWYGSAYLLSITALQPTFGNIYKYFDVKSTYLISIAVFEGGSIICAAAQNSPMFILGRAIAGAGAAGLFQGALGIVSHTVALPRRPMFLGIVVSVFGLATCFGPILGGAFTSNVSWRWCFYINVPVGVPAFVLIAIFFQFSNLESEDRRLSMKAKLLHMDLAGASVLIAAICCLLLALQWGGTSHAWSSSLIIGLFVGFALLIVGFTLLQWRLGEKATIPLRFFKHVSLVTTAAYTFLMYATNYVDGYYLPFYFQAVQGVSASQSGIRFISLAAPEVVTIVLTGVIVTRIRSYIPFMALSAIVAAVGTGLLSTIGLDTSTVQWAAFMVITGVGIGLGIQLPYTAVQMIASESDVPIMNAIVAFFSQLGGAIAIPVGQTIFVNTLTQRILASGSSISPNVVISAGATNLKQLATDKILLRSLQAAYSHAVTNDMYFAVALVAVAAPLTVSMQYQHVKSSRKNGDLRNQGFEDDSARIITA